MEDFCQQPIYPLFEQIPFLEQRILYQECQKAHPQHRFHRLCISYFELPICKFVTVLSQEEQTRILLHLKEREKTQHWMWWAFPQEQDSWTTHRVSQRTKEYALTLEGAMRFLCVPSLLHYYKKAMEQIDHKVFRQKESLRIYFGPTDFLKFISHVHLFLRASQRLHLHSLSSFLHKLQQILEVSPSPSSTT